jgi:hypothetical protein
MKNKSKQFIYLIIMAALLISCQNLTNEAKGWLVNDNMETIPGKYHFLDDTGTKIFLPTDFERLSLAEYQKLIKTIATKKEYDFEISRLKTLKEMDGSLYIFFDKKTRSTYTINTVPFFKFSRDNASQLLGLIQSRNNKISKNTGATFTKISAKYGGNKNQQLFKVIYKVKAKKLKNEIFNSSYIISSNEKTIFVQLTTTFEADFDPFIEKIIF